MIREIVRLFVGVITCVVLYGILGQLYKRKTSALEHEIKTAYTVCMPVVLKYIGKEEIYS